ncbi:RHS repeat-associated core domain-containing protein [Pseudomonas sp. 9Ag]|uniref:RHS repeat-associated core domain-containing protein n=1 Tax=Pseudomonas sp. 9Ag TaxID=2653167 RepID=UPI001357C9D1|nr:RHS repeat-associated core domain-containing protein [Pseudomonas sp. 9Ag]
MGSMVTDLSYASDSNRLGSIDGLAVTSDAAGSLTQYSNNRNFEYDAQGRLAQVKVASNVIAQYRYNALGQRTHKITGTATTTFFYGPNGQLLGETQYSPTGTKLSGQFYVWLDSLPLGGITLAYDAEGGVTSSSAFYLHTDHLNTPRLATNQSGVEIWRWKSDAFGVGDVVGTATINLRFPGQYFDSESGLHYNFFRDYDPATGRYVESDPIGLEGGLNTFGYVLGNPLRYSDPFGLMVDDGLGGNVCTPGFEGLICSPTGSIGPIGGGKGAQSRQGDQVYCPIPRPAPDFVVTPKGTAVPVPAGASGPSSTRKPGFQYNGGSGGHSMDSKVTGVRIMDANSNQGSRAIYMNTTGQTVNPATGRTVPNADPSGHHYLD